MELRLALTSDLRDPKVLELVQQAVDQSPDEIDVEYVLLALDGERTLLWVVEGEGSKGVLFTSIVSQGRATELLLWLGAGENVMMASKELQDKLSDVASRCGCSTITAVVTNQKLLKHMTTRLGYQAGGVVVRKEVINVRTDTGPNGLHNHLN